MEEERLLIKIDINGLVRKLNIRWADEEFYRKAEKALNERIRAYNDRFNLSEAQILSMVAYEMAVEVFRQEADRHTTPRSELDKIKSMLEKARMESLDDE